MDEKQIGKDLGQNINVQEVDKIRKKFSLKKFEKDRNRSLEASKKGDYRLIENNEGRSNIVEIITNIQFTLKPINCEHDKVGCELPYTKRTMQKCKECYNVR